MMRCTNVHIEGGSVMELRTPEEVGRFVRLERRRRRMSQQDLADAAHVSRRWLIELEAGRPRAELGLVLAVLAALGTPLRVGANDPAGSAPADTHRRDLDDDPSPRNVDLDAHLRRLAGSG
jgi:HTH-type transcriptional regulator/antitoxin HipB